MLSILEHMPFIGSIVGFVASFVGDYIKSVIQSKTQSALYKQSLELNKQNIALTKLQIQNQQAMAHVKYNLSVQKTARTQAKSPASTWVNDIRGLVRPLVTYIFVGVFVFIKIWQAIHGGLWGELWDVYTQTLLSTILAFWFGQRLMSDR